MDLEIVLYGEDVLHEMGTPIENFDANLKDLFDAMVVKMHDAEGIGLASQQIGKALSNSAWST